MEIFIYKNGSQQGPYSIEQIKDMNLSPGTPVWYSGLADWTPASVAPATAGLFGGSAYGAESEPSSASSSGDAPQNQGQQSSGPQAGFGQTNFSRQGTSYGGYNNFGGYNYGPQYAPGQQGPYPDGQPPKSYLGWAIVSTICCCLPLGIVAIIFATQVNSKWIAHDYAGAYKASQRAQLWTILAIVLGLVGGFFSGIIQALTFPASFIM